MFPFQQKLHFDLIIEINCILYLILLAAYANFIIKHKIIMQTGSIMPNVICFAEKMCQITVHLGKRMIWVT